MKNSLLLFSLVTVTSGVADLAFSPQMAQGAELCNYRNEIVRVSGAYVNKDEVWVTKGWWDVQPGECMTYPDNWYTYVEVDRDQTVERTHLLSEGVEAIKLCVIQDRYTFYNGETEMVCDKHDYGFSDNSMQTFYLIGSKRELIGYKQ